MTDQVTDQLGKSPETISSTPEAQLSVDEKARQELQGKQKAEVQQVTVENIKSKSEVIEQSSTNRAELTTPMAEKSTTISNAPSGGQAGSSAPEKSFGTKFKEFFSGAFGKIKEFFGVIGTKISEFFGKIFGKKKDAQSSMPSPSPSDTAPITPDKSVERNPGSWKAAVESEAKRLGIEPAFAFAIVTVEAGKNGLNSNGTPVIRFEPHVFNDQLAKRGVHEKHGKWGSSTLNNRNVDGVSCEGGQANEQACLQKAISINKEAAYNSISMGLGQIMGFNSASAGYPSAESMYQSFSASGGGEVEQIKGMFKLLENNKGHLNAARNKDFTTFARLYNGSGRVAYYSNALQNAYRANGGGSNSAIA